MVHVKKLDISFNLNDIRQGLNDVLKLTAWHPKHMQIGLTQSIGYDASNSWYDATGSLVYDWEKAESDENGHPELKRIQRKEQDFCYTVPEIRNTPFEDIINVLSRTYILGRVRLMYLKPKHCMSWHTDTEKRLHIPILTNVGAHLVIQGNAYHLEADGSVYIADTTQWHTAFNGGLEPRVHLVGCVLGEK